MKYWSNSVNFVIINYHKLLHSLQKLQDEVARFRGHWGREVVTDGSTYSGRLPRSEPWPLPPPRRPLRSKARSRRRSSRHGATRGTGQPPRRRSPTPSGSTRPTRSTPQTLPPPTPSRRTTTMRTRRRSSRRPWKSGQVMCAANTKWKWTDSNYYGN